MYVPQVAFKPSSADVDALPSGTTTRGVVTQIFHLGTIENEYEGEKSLRDTIWVEFELARKKPDGQRYTIGRECGVNLGKANPTKGQKTILRRLATACLGPDLDENTFTPWVLLGKTCQIQTGLTSGGRMKIENYTALDDELAPIKPIGKMIAWSILDPNCRQNDSDVPDFLLSKAKNCRELTQPSSPAIQDSMDKKMADRFDATRVKGHAVNPDDDDAPF